MKNKVRVIRYADEGFVFRPIYSGKPYRLYGKSQIMGCFAFCRFVDDFALTGHAAFRRGQKEHTIFLDKDTIVYARNTIPGYIQGVLTSYPFYDDIDEDVFVPMPLWLVEERCIEVFKHRNKSAKKRVQLEKRCNHLYCPFEWSEIILVKN